MVKSAIYLIKNQRFHECTKHIGVRFHFIRDVVEEGAIKVEKVITNDNAADMLTKIVPLAKFAHCKDLAVVCINWCNSKRTTARWSWYVQQRFDSSCFLQWDCPVSLEVLAGVVYTHAWNTNQGGDWKSWFWFLWNQTKWKMN